MSWSTAEDFRQQVQRLWDRGLILSAAVTSEPLFPRRLTLKGPTSSELLDRFEESKAWARRLLDLGHLRFEMREARHRVLGTNAMPSEVWVQSAGDAVAMLRKQRDYATFLAVAKETEERCPSLLAWITRRPLRVLDLSEAWPSLLSVVEWALAHPRPGIYLRQIDIPGVHTKFIEANLGVLGELLDLVLLPAWVDSTAIGVEGFCRRYGFLNQPECIRFRILDQSCPLLPGLGTPDVTLDADSFSRLGKIADRVFITENKTNFLAFPALQDSIVVFGAGYGLRALGSASWLQGCEIHYWGDIDTHGFAILDELRSHHGHVASFLMDRETLLAFRPLWGVEDSPTRRDLQLLTAPELTLYTDLQDNLFQPHLRLEQERIGFQWVLGALERLGLAVESGSAGKADGV